MLVLQKHLPFFPAAHQLSSDMYLCLSFKWAVIISKSKRCPLLKGVAFGNGSRVNLSQTHYGILMDCKSGRTWVLLGIGCSTAALLLWISWSTGLPIFNMSWICCKESAGLDPVWKWEKVQKGEGPLPFPIKQGVQWMFKLSVLSSSLHPTHLFCS